MTVVIDSITTADAVPTTAPFKVSNVSGHTDATILFTVSGTGPVRAYKIKRGGSAITNGFTLADVGAVTGLGICGQAEPTAISTPHQFTEVIVASELPAEGNHTMNLYVYNGSLFQ